MRRLMLTKDRIKNIVWLVIYYLILCLIYVFWMSPKYSYAGFKLSFSLLCMTISIACMVIASIMVSLLIARDGIADTIIVFLALLYFYPQMVLYALNLNDTGYFLFAMLYFFCLCTANLYFPISKRTTTLKGRSNLFEVAIVILGLLMVGISGAFAGFRISFDLSDYYDYRYAVRDMAIPGIFRYILNWVRTLLPIGLIYALVKKKKWLIAFVTIAQILCFSFDGKKSALFIFLLAFVVAFLFKSEYRKHMPQYMCLLGSSVIFESLLRHGESFIGTYIIRRMMFIPSYLGWAYYDFFKVNELDYLKSSILRRFGFKSTYTETIPIMIGRLYYSFSSSNAVNANTGLCGDAFSNFGWYSLLIYPIMNVIIFKIIGKYTAGLDGRIQIIIILTVAYTFLSGSFFSILLTNGVLLLILLMIIIPKRDLLSANSQSR